MFHMIELLNLSSAQAVSAPITPHNFLKITEPMETRIVEALILRCLFHDIVHSPSLVRLMDIVLQKVEVKVDSSPTGLQHIILYCLALLS